MTRSSAQAATGDRTDPSTEVRWSRIGINAVAAASICKPNGKGACKDETSSKRAFPFAETDFATD
ncbi:hypothetical protein [Microbaculum marinum]|uniref:Uncharacterized protein n=1 Tax=Microbaculum marinum TaxID=1764581 RepID=A0AAW9RHH3_9HYPH